MQQLGRRLLLTCAVVRQIPDGLLVFFPSYYVMQRCVGAWQADGTYRRMERHKAIVVEPRTSAEIVAVASAFRDAVDSGQGAIFFAVCRGKVLETYGLSQPGCLP